MIRFFRTLFIILRSYGESLVDAFQENEYTQRFQERYPRLYRFVRNRLSPSEYLGLHLTIGFFIVLYLTIKIIEFLRALTTASSVLLETDIRFMNLIVALRTGEFLKPMLFLTALANWPTIVLLFLFVTTILVWKKRWFRAWMLTLAVFGSGALSLLLKIFIVRPRPDPVVALLSENTYGFPSGHALVGLAFYGMVAYLLLYVVSHFWRRVLIVFFALAVIASIGMSRLYLGVHWLSDVVGGTLLGLVWLAILITAAEIHASVVLERRRASEHFLPFAWVLPLLVVFLLGAFVYIGIFTFEKRSSPLSIHERSTASSALLQSSFDGHLLQQLPSISEGLTGKLMEPVSIILLASDEELFRAFTKAQWELADPLSIQTVIKTIGYIFRDEPYAHAPVSPAFLSGQPQTYSFEQATDAGNVGERHHIRLWKHPTVTIDGKALWMGTASFDASLKLSPTTKIPTHKIAPAIDRERDYVVQSLEGQGVVQAKEILERYEPFLGINFAGDPFFTDGRVVILYVK